MAEPTAAHGKICYIQLPAIDIQQSAEFYKTVFGWNIRTRGDGATSFDDSTGAVSGVFDTSLKAVDDSGFRVYIMVDSVRDTAEAITNAGGASLDVVEINPGELYGSFRDPAGNVLRSYEYNPPDDA